MKQPRQPGMKARSVLALALAIGFLAQASNVLAQDAPKAKPTVKADAPKADKNKAPVTKATTLARQPAAPGANATPPTAGDVNKLAPSKKGQPSSKKGRIADQGKAAPAKRGIPEPTVVLKPGEVPKIKFDTPVYDFGRIAAGTQIQHEYWFTNVGTGPLEVLKVKPG